MMKLVNPVNHVQSISKTLDEEEEPFMPRILSLRAPAKINWTLAVTARRPDGFHEIDSILQAVSLWDELTFRPIEKPVCSIRCGDPRVPTGPANLIHRAWVLMRAAYPSSVRGLSVKLGKSIPSGAGLGGGSSDAAAALIAVNRLFELRLRRRKLAEFAARIGSDVPFFIFGGAARCLGRGEKIEPLTDRLPRLHLVIVHPGFESSTAMAYAHLKPKHFAPCDASTRAARAIARGHAKSLAGAISNTFDRVLPKVEKRYEPIKKALRRAGLDSPILTGSGSACFALAENAAAARKACMSLSGHYPGVFAVGTLKSGVRAAAKGTDFGAQGP